MGGADNKLSQARNIKATGAATETIGSIKDVTVPQFPRPTDHYRTQAVVLKDRPLSTGVDQFQWWFS